MSDLADLRSARTLPQLARVLGVKSVALSSALYWLRPDQKYNIFSIPKKGGGRRAITAPSPQLKYIQSKLAVLLAAIQSDLERSRTKRQCVLSHGFKKEYSIITNASLHRNRRFVFNADLKDFFPSINFGRVLGFFLKDQNFKLDAKIATIIAQIACHNNQLPQGSPCSPVVSNLIAHILDIHLNRLAASCRCTYTRYVDDLTFSTNEKSFPIPIGRFSEDLGRWVAGNEFLVSVYRSGFQLNESKTRLQQRDSRQDATGLIVNKKVNVRHEYYKEVRAMCHQLFCNGFSYVKSDGRVVPVSDEKLLGMMNFIYQIRKLKTENFKVEQKGFFELYGKLLDYHSFYGLARPRIICEGKTDAIYLRSAIRALQDRFPGLVKPPASSTLLVDFFNYTPAAALFQGLSGGGDELNKLLSRFGSRISSFHGGPYHPVIMVVDNDDGSKKIFAHLSNILGTGITGAEGFYHAYANLYVVPIPKVGPKTAIEDLFDSDVLAKKIDGKEFDRTGKEKDGTKWYGKFEFATKVIRPERESIKFDRFEPLLKAFVDVMDDYANRRATIAAKARAA